MKVMIDSPTRTYVLQTLDRYWSRGSGPIAALPIPQAAEGSAEVLPPRMVLIALPRWAHDVGVAGTILVPAHTLLPTSASAAEPEWARTDWVGAAFWYLNGTAERAHESLHGPIDSYALRLKGWDARIWHRAWVNRIALFLRRWGARQREADEAELLGPLPQPEFILTHDVDAVRKTVAIRLKQSAFHLFNTARLLRARRPIAAVRRLARAARFLLAPARYWRFDEIMHLEERHGLRSHFNFYGGPGGPRRRRREVLLDPAYCVEQPRLAETIRRLRAGGWTIGLHPSFDARDDAGLMASQHRRLEKVLGAPVTTCRQHWLRFSWDRTWRAQESVGLRLDTTLGFNDRPGFRNGAALRFRPWCKSAQGPMALEAVPLVFMDSQFYDYAPGPSEIVAARIRDWLDEICAVCGTATVLWHQRVLCEDYGWGEGFQRLLEYCEGD